MKLALSTAIAVALAAGCSVSHRSSDFVCDGQQLCAAGRTCVDGFCVIAGDSGVQSPPPGGDAGACPSQCTSCTAGKTCVIDCALNGSACSQAVLCPPGWNCHVLCSLPNQCNTGVLCGTASACTIECTGRQTCRNLMCGTGACNVTCSGRSSCGSTVTCGTGACKVDCAGDAACGGLVSCGLACACDVTCGTTACDILDNIDCKPGCATQMAPLVCTSAAAGCNTCQ
jgi:hypothetical protein